MAKVVAGLGCSHAPSIAHAYDAGASRDPGMTPLFDAFAQAARWLAEQRPDALVVIYNDHVDNYFFDAWPTFAIGIADDFQIADEGWGPRRFAAVPGHRALARHIAAQLLGRGIDLMTSHRMELDHGFLSPMPMVDEGWRVPVVPMTINVVLDPLPTPARCWTLGAAVGAAIESYPEDLRVAVIGTGGLSHQLTGPDFGKVFAHWDREFLTLLDHAPQSLVRYTMADFARLGGEHSIEVVQWLAMRAALPEPSRMEFKYYYPFGLMGYAVAAFRPS
ncbi:MAG TPA: class III extradiol dioxygenase family protein [Candidatus Binataceae bacterium]|jgi:aromatic ring-opening dioxygenase catalytic subunit (LigB family)|nr:class III extradiol dioxygenase family protein [Candidatus Binataceae bacterium]